MVADLCCIHSSRDITAQLSPEALSQLAVKGHVTVAHSLLHFAKSQKPDAVLGQNDNEALLLHSSFKLHVYGRDRANGTVNVEVTRGKSSLLHEAEDLCKDVMSSE